VDCILGRSRPALVPPLGWSGPAFNAQAIEALDASADYRDTVAAIGAAGFLRPPQTVEVMTVDAGWLTSFGAERDQLL
jgi:hypothetical protein